MPDLALCIMDCCALHTCLSLHPNSHPSIISYRSVLAFAMQQLIYSICSLFSQLNILGFDKSFQSLPGHLFKVESSSLSLPSSGPAQTPTRDKAGDHVFSLMVQKHLQYFLPRAGKFLSSNFRGVTQGSWSEGQFSVHDWKSHLKPTENFIQ